MWKIKRLICVCDLDNSVYTNYPGWDHACALAAKHYGWKPFTFTHHADGSRDHGFAMRSIAETLTLRLHEIGEEPHHIESKTFFETLGEKANVLGSDIRATKFEGIETFLEFLRRVCHKYPIILSGGPRPLQIRALRQTELLPLFHQPDWFFLGDFITKERMLKKFAERFEPCTLIHISDTPDDMAALHASSVKAERKIAIGVTAAGMVRPKALRDAGADFIIERFTNETIRKFYDFVNT